MKYYFIDYENVHADGFLGVENIESKSVIYVFYSDQNKAFTLDILEKAEKQGVSIKACKAEVGSKNALDFQLSSFLGYVIGKEGENVDAEFIIIAKDAGYDKIVDFWKVRGRKICRFCNLAGKETAVQVAAEAQGKKKAQGKKMQVKKKAAATKGIVQATKEELQKILSADEYSDKILDIVNGSKTKQAINIGLSKEFKDSKKSGAIYKKLKPLLQEKKKT